MPETDPVVILPSELNLHHTDLRPEAEGTGGELFLPDLDKVLWKFADAYNLHKGVLDEAIAKDEPDSEAAITAREQLNFYDMIYAAWKMQESRDGERDGWAQYLTERSLELFGGPNREIAARLLREDYQHLLALRHNSSIPQHEVEFLIDTYRSRSGNLLDDVTGSATPEAFFSPAEMAILERYAAVIRERFGGMFEAIDEALGENSVANAEVLANVFTQALARLAQDGSPDWADYKIELTNGAGIVIDVGEAKRLTTRKIKIGRNYQALAAEDVPGVVAHELLGHALRSNNGYILINEAVPNSAALGEGNLPDLFRAEEGNGLLIEIAINGGRLPRRVINRYLGNILALGLFDNGRQTNRLQLFDIINTRERIQAALEGQQGPEAMSATRAAAWRVVDDIYRANPGDEPRPNYAIYTRGILYLEGINQAFGFVKRLINAGWTADKVFYHSSLAMIDPDNGKHVELLEQALAAKRAAAASA